MYHRRLTTAGRGSVNPLDIVSIVLNVAFTNRADLKGPQGTEPVLDAERDENFEKALQSSAGLCAERRSRARPVSGLHVAHVAWPSFKARSPVCRRLSAHGRVPVNDRHTTLWPNSGSQRAKANSTHYTSRTNKSYNRFVAQRDEPIVREGRVRNADRLAQAR